MDTVLIKYKYMYMYNTHVKPLALYYVLTKKMADSLRLPTRTREGEETRKREGVEVRGERRECTYIEYLSRLVVLCCLRENDLSTELSGQFLIFLLL